MCVCVIFVPLQCNSNNQCIQDYKIIPHISPRSLLAYVILAPNHVLQLAIPENIPLPHSRVSRTPTIHIVTPVSPGVVPEPRTAASIE